MLPSDELMLLHDYVFNCMLGHLRLCTICSYVQFSCMLGHLQLCTICSYVQFSCMLGHLRLCTIIHLTYLRTEYKCH